MRKVLTILLTLVTLTSYASSIEGVGLVTQVENGKDTLLFFKNEIRLRSTRGDVNWFKTDGTPVATNTDEIYPDDGGYYTELAGDISSPVYAFLYTDAGECTLTCVPDCGATTLTLAGDTKPFAYTRSNGSNASYARACTIHYNALAWNTEQWVDSAATIDASLRPGNYILPRPKSPYASLLQLKGDKQIGGYLTKQNQKLLKDATVIAFDNVGAGTVVLFSESPTYRGYWLSTSRILTNALFFGNGNNVSGSSRYRP